MPPRMTGDEPRKFLPFTPLPERKFLRDFERDSFLRFFNVLVLFGFFGVSRVYYIK